MFIRFGNCLSIVIWQEVLKVCSNIVDELPILADEIHVQIESL